MTITLSPHRLATTATAFISSGNRGRSSGGFTLIELAVVIFIVALLLGSIFVPLQTQVESRNYDQTQRILDQAREALIGYVAANGYFPCPASGTSNGQEPVGTNHATAAVNTCPAAVWGVNMYHGFLPAAALGFTPTDANGYAVDAWGLTQNRIRYSVSNVTVNAITQPFTRVNGMRNAGMSNVLNCVQGASSAVCTLPSSATAAQGLIYVCNSGTGVAAGPPPTCGTAVKLTDNAIVVIWSVGPNAATTGGASVDEAQNPNPVGGSADRVFVSRTRSGGTSGEFDDIVTWIGTPSLFNRLIAAGQLP